MLLFIVEFPRVADWESWGGTGNVEPMVCHYYETVCNDYLGDMIMRIDAIAIMIEVSRYDKIC